MTNKQFFDKVKNKKIKLKYARKMRFFIPKYLIGNQMMIGDTHFKNTVRKGTTWLILDGFKTQWEILK